jgi:hypothetical protein
MSHAWAKDAAERVAEALEQSLCLPESPRRELLVRATRTCTGALAGPAPDAGAVAVALRNAMMSALVLTSEDAAGQAIAASLGAAYNLALAPLRPARLEAAALPQLVDALHSFTRAEPRTVSVARALFALEDAAIALEDVLELSIDPLDQAEERIASLDEPDPEAPSPERPPRHDWRPEEGVVPDPAPVRLIEERRTLSRAGYHAAVVEQCLDAIATRARDRTNDPFSQREIAEQRILEATDAILASGGACVATVLSWWRRASDSPSAWCSWAAPFVLGSIEGADALLAVREGLESLAPGAFTHAAQAAEALAIVPHPDLPALAVDLAASAHPVARAVGVDMLARAGQLTVDQLRQQVFDANPPVMMAALEAIGRLPAADAAPLVPLLERWIHFPDPTVAWVVARALLRWQHGRPYEELRSNGPLVPILGGRAVELFALVGSRSDVEPLKKLVGKSARTPALFAALGRFGHPGVAPFLLHHLPDDDLGEHAAAALVTLFGAWVEPEAIQNASAWRSALLREKPDPELRYRKGEVWKPRSLAAECASGELSRAEMEPAIDELLLRGRIEWAADLGQWTSGLRPALASLPAATAVCDRSWPASGWA